MLRSELIADCKGPDCSEKIHPPYKDVKLVSRREIQTNEVDVFNDSELIANLYLENSGEFTDSKDWTRTLSIEKPSENFSRPEPNFPITILNCFWPSVNKKQNCVSLYKMKSDSKQTPHYKPKFDERPDKILNFTFNFNAPGSSINNKRFKYMNQPLHQGTSSHKKCSENIHIKEKCTQIIKVQLGEIIELRLTRYDYRV